MGEGMLLRVQEKWKGFRIPLTPELINSFFVDESLMFEFESWGGFDCICFCVTVCAVQQLECLCKQSNVCVCVWASSHDSGEDSSANHPVVLSIRTHITTVVLRLVVGG